MGKIRFTGMRDELEMLLFAHGIRGGWRDEPNGVVMMRHQSGANLHWSSTTGRLWVDGPPAAAARLCRALMALAYADETCPRLTAPARPAAGLTVQL